VHRLETLVMQAAPTWPLAAVRSHLHRCIDAIVHVERTAGGARQVAEIAELGDATAAENVADGPAMRIVVQQGAVVATLHRSRRWERR
jgi:Flp pilus assembly CpaF family ATPase